MKLPAPLTSSAVACLLAATCFKALAAESDMYPNTAWKRNAAVRDAAVSLQGQLDDRWPVVRRRLLSACGLRDLPRHAPGRGNTGHCFGDFNHVDCCTMAGGAAFNTNQGQVPGIAQGNQLGHGIRAASVVPGSDVSAPEDEGSWCTCQLGASTRTDVCHVQFRAQVGFKAVWCPGEHEQHEVLALIGEDHALLAWGRPSGRLPPGGERYGTFTQVHGSPWAAACTEAERLHAQAHAVPAGDEL